MLAMCDGTLIFCERTGQWAAAWRQAWGRCVRSAAGEAPEIRTVETRTAAECFDNLRVFPGAFVVVELTEDRCERSLELLAEISARHRGAAVAAAGPRSLRDYEWRIREFGAVHFVASPRELPALSRIVERHAARSPQPELDTEARIWDSLPWGG